MFEYTLNQKPIVCISCGKGEVGEETLFIRELNLGIAVEEITGTQDVENLSKYLVQQYELKSQSKSLLFEPNKSTINLYDHDELVNSVENLCKNLI